MFQQWRLKRWCLIRFKNKQFDLIARCLNWRKTLKVLKTIFNNTHSRCVSLLTSTYFFQTVITGALCYLCMSFIQCVKGYVVTLKDFDYYPYAFFLKKRRGYCNRLRLSVCLSVRPSVRPSCYRLLNNWKKFNQMLCMSYSHEWGMQQQFFLAPPSGALGRGQKVKYHLISITKLISKMFIPNCVCVLTNERYKIYQTGF